MHLGGLGDVVQSLPDLRRIRASAPDARLDLLVARRVEPLLGGMTGPTRIWTLEIEERRVDWLEAGRLAWRLRREGYDTVVNLLPSGSLLGALKMSAFLLTIGGGGRSVPGSPLPRPADHPRFNLEPGIAGKSEAESWLREAGLEPGPAGGLIGVAPGSAWPAKRWSPEKFAWVADRLAAEMGAKIVLLGSEADRAPADAVARAMAKAPASAVGRLSLRGFLALAGRLRLLLTNDSGAMHLAAAAPGMGAPIVAIFGPGDVRRYAPSGARVVRHDVPCSPCNYAVCPIGNPCLTAITADEVLEACRVAA